MILNLFMFNINLEETLLCAITHVQRATKISMVFVREFTMKMKQYFNVFLMRYGPINGMIWFHKQCFGK